jgi:thiamine biosynthesis lipoprotein
MSFQTLRFQAMACPCEILLDTMDPSIGAKQLETAVKEATRIENKFSRYIEGNVVDRINTSGGEKVEVDGETAALLDYAAQCNELSDGLFDITTGVLRKLWRFEGDDSVPPTEAELARVLTCVGWDKIKWQRPRIELPQGFEIDFGGICKEYAADRILDLLRKHHDIAALVNLGGDIAAAGQRLWSVGIEDVSHPGQMVHTVHLRHGGVATSGTTRRFVKVNGKTFGHILNPKTGWPVKQAPSSVTVAAKTCTEAGFWSTLAVLHGSDAEKFLDEQKLENWCYRSDQGRSEKREALLEI